MNSPAIKIRNLHHAWPGAPEILAIEDFELACGERVFLAGPSGSGKSTLLGLIAGVTPVQRGEIEVLGTLMDPAKSRARDRLRADEIGMIFQLFNLVPYLSAVENVLLPLGFSSRRADQLAQAGTPPAEEAVRLLSALGLGEDIHRKQASNLSVGQQQRVAAARALIGGPGLIIADEPTSALDEDSRESFLELLSAEAQRSNAALMFVSHERSLSERFDRFVELPEINHAGGVAA